MARFTICVTNNEALSRDDGAEYDGAEAAMAAGVESGVAIIADEIRRGERNAAVEVIILGDNEIAVLRSVVAISVSRLMPRDAAITSTLSEGELNDSTS